MNDLISRKALLDILRELSTCESATKVVSELENEIERLKTLRNNCTALCDHEVIGIEDKAYRFAIETVKRGGKNE